jgi:hypothetical protein
VQTIGWNTSAGWLGFESDDACAAGSPATESPACTSVLALSEILAHRRGAGW